MKIRRYCSVQIQNVVGVVAPCIDTEWTCFNRKCISRDLLCNNVDDCGDDSDESYAHAECGGLYNGLVIFIMQ